jgi:predicted house-cleaning noncanonical NTP pyrophosphatase (MazG superfamily)
MRHDKLVRDKIPAILTKQGITLTSHIAAAEEYQQALRQKLQEEVKEFLADENPEELADILEVIYALADNSGINQPELETIRTKKSH